MDDPLWQVSDAALDDLRSRIRATRRIPVVAGGWARGVEPEFVTDLLEYWAERYDWRAAESRIRSLPWVETASGIRLIDQRADDRDAPAVLLLHGWPDSFLRYERVLPMLTDLHVVVPCLPGYPGSGSPGTANAEAAEPIAAAMAELGYERYVVSGGDIGTYVAEALARYAPDRVGALHLTDVPAQSALAAAGAGAGAGAGAQLSDDDQAFANALQAYLFTEGAYSVEQATKPATLAVGLGDSPAGLLAWIVEKLRAFSDCGGDVETVWPRDDLLTWVTVYWLTGSIGTSFSSYAERQAMPARRLDIPTVVSQFPKDVLHAPRSLAERLFDVRVWDEQSSGGHFVAWERPDAFVESLRAAVSLM